MPEEPDRMESTEEEVVRSISLMKAVRRQERG
jgi:hypothetical protein